MYFLGIYNVFYDSNRHGDFEFAQSPVCEH